MGPPFPRGQLTMDASLEPLKENHADTKVKRISCERSSFISKIIFWWTRQIFSSCNHSKLEGESIQDVYKIEDKDSSHYLENMLENNWKSTGNFLQALISTFKRDIIFTGAITFINEVILRCTQPLLLGKLLQYFYKENGMSQRDAFLITTALISTLALNILYLSHYSFRCFYAGLKMKSATSALLYQKLMATSLGDVRRNRNGNIINIFASDVSKFDQMLYYSHLMWSSVALSVITSALIVLEIGPDGLYGVAVVFVVCPIQSWTGTLTSKFRKKSAAYTDKRVKLMEEILIGIETIKIQVWEKPFQNMVSKLRKLELKWITRASYVRGLYMTFSIFTTRMALFTTLFVYIINGNKLSADRVFVVASLFSILSNTLAGVFIRGVAELSEINVSIKRIQSFLCGEENIEDKIKQQESLITVTTSPTEVKGQPGTLIMEKATASWVEGGEVTLKGVTIRAEPGSLVAVIGGVGSGKSSLLQVLLGELPLIEGQALLEARAISYSSQEPWIFSGSVRENIVFGRAFDRRRYNQVLKACALLPDIKRMRNGDLTLVGERGGALSGGQKARLTLARAAYAHANVDAYFLDEPLAALDVNVAKHVYKECIESLLRGTTRVLVTNQLHFLRGADLIVVLHEGAVVAQGKYEDVLQHAAFSELIKAGVAHQLIKSLKSERIEEQFPSGKDTLERPDKEKIIQGKVSVVQYLQYLTSGSSYLGLLFLLSLFIATQFVVSGSDYWVSICISLDASVVSNFANLSHPDKHVIINEITRSCLGTYTVLIVCLFMIVLTRSLYYFDIAKCASRNTHKSMLMSTIHAKMSFFRNTPSGRILNRFSSDLLAVDVNLPRIMLDMIQYFMLIIGSFVIIFSVSAVFAIPVAFFLIIILQSKKRYLKTSRVLKRVDATMRSPIFSLLSDTISGLTTVRAFKKQESLQEQMQTLLDNNFATGFLSMSASTSFGFLLDVVCLVFIAIVTVVLVMHAEYFSSEQVGLAITQAMSITTLLQWCVRQSAETENLMTNYERATEFTKIEREEFAPVPVLNVKDLKGDINFKNVSLDIGHRASILQNVNVCIEKQKKVGVAGRTGAGKSSLVKVLFRLDNFQGSVKIGRVDISSLPLSLLRKKISMICQDPVIFSGNVRQNLDPCHIFSDAKLFAVVQDVGLGDVVATPEEINKDITGTLSVGQKQLLCLGRALLSKSNILILDEATANIDYRTDALIQKLICDKFSNCTVIQIAHRLQSLKNCDSIILMEKGKVVNQVNYVHNQIKPCNTQKNK